MKRRSKSIQSPIEFSADAWIDNDGKRVFRFQASKLPPSLNGSGGMKRMHYRLYAKERDLWQRMVMLGLRRHPSQFSQWPGPISRCHILFQRRSTHTPDWDNLCASFKVIGDALVAAGVITDDSIDVIEMFMPEFLKVAHRKEQGVLVVVSSVDHTSTDKPHKTNQAMNDNRLGPFLNDRRL